MSRALISTAVAAALVAGGCASKAKPVYSAQAVDLTRRTAVDMLFMIDDSNSETGQQELQKRFPQLVKRIDALGMSGLPASYHIGVIDSDLGAAGNLQACAKAGGDGGKLRVGPDSATSFPAPANCTNFTLTDDYLDYNQIDRTNNIGGGLDVASAFSCMASVGDQGCGFEHQLEAIHLALSPGVNPGFLRDEALLVVVILTDEDDCSAPPDTDLFDNSAAGVAKWGVLQSFRCTQWGIACNGQPLDGNALAPTDDCKPVDGGPLYDVSRYIAMFADGGIKKNAGDVILASFNAPPSPVSVTVSMPCQGQPTVPSCGTLDHSCVSGIGLGDPAVRIAAVTATVPGAITTAVCDTDYSSTFDAVADTLATRMRGGCLGGSVADLAVPGCTVTTGGVAVPRCVAGATAPCWDLVEDPSCPAHATPSGGQQRARLTYSGAPSTTVDAVCPFYQAAS